MSKNFLALTVLVLVQTGFAKAHDLHYYVIEDIAAPFQIQDQDGKHRGIITEVVFALRDRLSISLEVIPAPTRRIERILGKETDFDWITYDAPVWNSLTTGEMLPEPLFEVHHAALHCPELPADSLFENRPSFAIIKGFRYPELSSQEEQDTLSLVPVRDYEKGFELVDLRRVSAFVEMSIRLKHQIAISSYKQECQQLTRISEVVAPYWIHLAVNKDMPESKKRRFNNALIEMKANGQIDEILHRYSAK